MNKPPSSLLLWLPSNELQDTEALEAVTKANGFTMDFCNSVICFEQLLDELSSAGVCVDSYLDNLELTLAEMQKTRARQ